MQNYILSILGIVMAGVLIDVILPSGSINKYIKGIYSIFIVGILINPLLKIVGKPLEFKFASNEIEISQDLYQYIGTQRTKSLEFNIENKLKEEGLSNLDIIINFSIENNNLKYNSCEVNLKNLVISQDKQHINKYEFISDVVKEYTSLTDEVIIFNE